MFEKYGVDARWGTRATALIQDSDGSVTGVYAEDSEGTVYQISAKGGVCLCCGGFVHNQEMLNKYFSCEMMSISNGFVDGSGILMAQAAGAQMGKNFSISLYEFGGSNPKDPKTGFSSSNDILYLLRMGNLAVNKHGKRFMNEEWLSTQTMFCGEPLIREGGYYYLVTDSRLLKEMTEKTMGEILGDGILNTPDDLAGQKNSKLSFPNMFEDAEVAIADGYCWKADTIEELAEISNLPHLAETVKRYNEFCASGVDTEMHKRDIFLRSIEEGPFYVVESKVNAWMTLGGIKTDEDCRALDELENPIAGLYCAGGDCDAWAIPYYQVTTTSGFGIATGYISAEAAAKRAQEL